MNILVMCGDRCAIFPRAVFFCEGVNGILDEPLHPVLSLTHFRVFSIFSPLTY